MLIYLHQRCLQAFSSLSSAPKAVCHPSPVYLQQTHCILTGHCQVWVLSLGLAKSSRSSNTSSLGLTLPHHHLVLSICPNPGFCTPCHKPTVSSQTKPNLVSLSLWCRGASVKHDIWTKQQDKGGCTQRQTGFVNDARNSSLFSYFYFCFLAL